MPLERSSLRSSTLTASSPPADRLLDSVASFGVEPASAKSRSVSAGYQYGIPTSSDTMLSPRTRST
jgi:hypothetical protein